jgi:heme/copper-type cytochrome/quinol oxidase subunit 3
MWVSARQLCGAAAFFFVSFVFAYFYLRSLDSNRSWKVGTVNPPIGWGIAVLVALLLSAVAMRIAATQLESTISFGYLALLLALVSIVFQAIAWKNLGFGPASGGYASVYVGWTAFYAFFTLFCAYWIETQVATAWRLARNGASTSPASIVSGEETRKAGLEACSYFWNFYVFNGLVLFVILYIL